MISFVLLFPPSTNGYWRSFRGRQIISAKGREYRANGLAELKRQGIPDQAVGRLAVTLDFYPPDKRPRDIDNFNKALFDLLTHAGVWQDDKQVKRLVINMHEPDHEYKGTVTVQIKQIV